MKIANTLLAIALLLVLAPLCFAEIDPFKTGYIKAKISASKSITAQGSVSASLTSYDIPQDGILSKTLPLNSIIKTDPQGNRFIMAEWSGTNELDYNLEFIVESHASFNSIATPPPFPMLRSSLPEGMETYIQESHYVRISPELAQKALEVTSGSRDSFDAAARLSDWVKEYMDYDLAYSDLIVPSDVIFENRKGVCAEHANLLIAMLRSIGIPARYASGLVYGGIETKSWQPHAWVEVYLGDAWISFDPTFGEIGYVDATHIRFSSVIDAYSLESKIEWTPASSKISLEQTEYVVEVLEIREIPAIVELSSIGNISIGQGSSISINANVKNAVPGCVGSEVSLAIYENKSDPKGSFSILAGETPQLAIVCPSMQDEVNWVILAPQELAEGYTYYYESVVYDPSSEQRVPISLDPLIDRSPEISFHIDKDVLALGETARISAEIRNTGDSEIKEILFFTGDVFEKKEVSIKKNMVWSFDFYFKPGSIGEKNALIYAPFNSVSIPYRTIASKTIRIAEVSASEFVRPGQSERIRITLENTGPSQNVRLSLDSEIVSDSFLVSMEPGSEKEITLELNIPNSTPIGRYPVNISASGTSIDTQTLELLVYNEPKLTVLVDLTGIYSGIGSYVEVSLENKGEIGLQNINVSISVPNGIEIISKGEGISVLRPGEKKMVYMQVKTDSLGEKNMSIELVYTDAFKSYDTSESIAFEVKQPGILMRSRVFISGLFVSLSNLIASLKG